MRVSVRVCYSNKNGFDKVLGIGYFTYFVQRKFNKKKNTERTERRSEFCKELNRTEKKIIL